MSERNSHDQSNEMHAHEHVCVHEPKWPGRRWCVGAAQAVGTLAAMPFARLVDVSKRALAAQAAGEARAEKAQGSSKETRIVLLGTAGGPPPAVGSAGIATAVVAGDGVYLVDCGRSAVTQFMNAGLDLSKIKGFFVTHLHLDHVIDLFDFFALGLTAPNREMPGISQPVPVYGPGRAAASAFLRPVDNPIGGANPIPGTADLMRLSAEAVAYQLNQEKLLGAPDVRDLIDVREIPVPAGVPASPNPPPSTLQPFPLFENDDVKVTATMVPHVFASYAFRFDTDDGSFVLSGDTAKSNNLITLSKDADVLVHEVVDLDGAVEAGLLTPDLRTLFLRGHTDVLEVGSIAQAAGAKHLVLDHFIPAQPGVVNQARWRRQAKEGYDGDVIVGRDLMAVTPAGKVAGPPFCLRSSMGRLW